MQARLDGFRRRGFAFALHMLGDPDEAADAVQDGISALWRHRNRLRTGEDPTPWFFRVLRNRCIDHLRKRRVRQHQPLEPNIASQHSDPSSTVEHDEFAARLRRELTAMDPQQREIILLRDYQDLSYAQIAEILSLPKGTVMSRLHRARMTLRDRLKDLLL